MFSAMPRMRGLQILDSMRRPDITSAERNRHIRFTAQADMCAALDYVRFRSKADMCTATSHVRFTPDSDRESGFPRPHAKSALRLK